MICDDIFFDILYGYSILTKIGIILLKIIAKINVVLNPYRNPSKNESRNEEVGKKMHELAGTTDTDNVLLDVNIL